MNSNLAKPQTHAATVSEKIQLAPEYYLLKFILTDFKYLAGQYVSFHLARPKLRHTLSIASAPDGDSFEILQCVTPGGQGSHWVEGLTPGDKIQFTGPLGRFLITDSPKSKVFVATGCGIAPFKAIITDYLKRGGKSQVRLYWGMRYEKDLFWQTEFKELASAYPNFHYKITLSKPENSWQGLKSRVTDQLILDLKNLPDAEYYLCGSSQMISDIKKQLSEVNVPSAQIFTELFY